MSRFSDAEDCQSCDSEDSVICRRCLKHTNRQLLGLNDGFDQKEWKLLGCLLMMDQAFVFEELNQKVLRVIL